MASWPGAESRQDDRRRDEGQEVSTTLILEVGGGAGNDVSNGSKTSGGVKDVFAKAKDVWRNGGASLHGGLS